MGHANVTIPLYRYGDLLQAADELEALEAAGVDNWSGYGEADWNGAGRRTEAEMQRISQAIHGGDSDGRNFTISRHEYLELYAAESRLAALEAAGVDNWPGCEQVDWCGIAEAVGARIKQIEAEFFIKEA